MRDADAFQIAGRLAVLGVEVRSAEMRESLAAHVHFAENGNREMRRHRDRAQRKRGRGVTR